MSNGKNKSVVINYHNEPDRGIGYFEVLGSKSGIFSDKYKKLPSRLRSRITFGGMLLIFCGLASILLPLQSLPLAIQYIASGHFTEYWTYLMASAGYMNGWLISAITSPIFIGVGIAVIRHQFNYFLEPHTFSCKEEYDHAPNSLTTLVIVPLALALFTISGVLQTKDIENTVFYDQTKVAKDRVEQEDLGFTPKQMLALQFTPEEVEGMIAVGLLKKVQLSENEGVILQAQKGIYLANFPLESQFLLIDTLFIAIILSIIVVSPRWAARFMIWAQYMAQDDEARGTKTPVSDLGKMIVQEIFTLGADFQAYITRTESPLIVTEKVDDILSDALRQIRGVASKSQG